MKRLYLLCVALSFTSASFAQYPEFAYFEYAGTVYEQGGVGRTVNVVARLCSSESQANEMAGYWSQAVTLYRNNGGEVPDYVVTSNNVVTVFDGGGESVKYYFVIMFFDGSVPYPDSVSDLLSIYNNLLFDTIGYQMTSIIFDTFACTGVLDTANGGFSTLNGDVLGVASSSEQISLDNGMTINNVSSLNADLVAPDSVGDSTVTSTANATQSGTTVNITNNNTVETNFELGDAPSGTPDTGSSDLSQESTVDDIEVTSFSDEFTGTKPDFTYVTTEEGGGTGELATYSIDYEKIFDEIKNILDAKLGYESLKSFLQSFSANETTPTIAFSLPVQVGDGTPYTWGFSKTLPVWSEVSVCSKAVLSVISILGTVTGIIRIFA